MDHAQATMEAKSPNDAFKALIMRYSSAEATEFTDIEEMDE